MKVKNIYILLKDSNSIITFISHYLLVYPLLVPPAPRAPSPNHILTSKPVL